MKFALLASALIFTSILSLTSLTAEALEVTEVDCLSSIEEVSDNLTNDQLDEVSVKCNREADDLFNRANGKQDKALLTQSSTARKSATIAKTIRQNRVKAEDNKKELELRKVQKK